MKVCLIDVDSKIPNLALMKTSTWHRSLGDEVKLGYEPLFDEPDLCYASKIFDFTSEPEYMPDCVTFRGGPGYDLEARLDFPDYDRIMPDYSLYPGFDYALGRFTRGCPNRCPWCVVPKMDGNVVHHVADLRDFWSDQRVVRLLDDNIMADSDEFCRDCEQLSKAGVSVIWEALDIRLVTDETAAALAPSSMRSVCTSRGTHTHRMMQCIVGWRFFSATASSHGVQCSMFWSASARRVSMTCIA